MSDYEFTLPLVVYIPRKTMKDKRFGVDINTFKSMDRHSYNNAKKIYSEHMRGQIEGFEMIDGKVHISYEYYAARNNSPDLDNFVGGAKKFFQDSLTQHGLIKDDNVHYIVSSSEKYCGVDRDNPRIKAKITVLD